MITRFSVFIAAIMLCGSFSPAHADVPAPREINVTTHSAPGWLPSEEQERQALQAALTFYDLMDREDYEATYNMFTGVTRAGMPISEYVSTGIEFHSKSGKIIERKLYKITWTKDPPESPQAGIYVAVDITSRFENIDRHCGYIILYKKTDGAPFEVMRVEQNYIDNATAIDTEKTYSKEYLDQVWRQFSAHCPNYSPD